jgi:hypothetical protein
MTPRALLATLAGPTIWAIGFSVLYGLSALACEYGWNGRLVLVPVWLLHCAALGWLVLWSWRWHSEGEAAPLLRFVAFAMALTGLVAMIWTGLPVATTSMCR